jgi:hypothetical protein
MTKIILLNAPPRAGKDTAARAIISALRDDGRRALVPEKDLPSYTDIVGFSHELKELTHRAYGLDLPHDAFEQAKAVPQTCFGGKTPREAYIHFSEEVMKPAFGQNIFGKLFVARLAHLKKTEPNRLVVVPDSGFVPEAEEVIRSFAQNNVLLLKIDAQRRGCTYEGDSRNYVDLPVTTHWIDNNRTGTIGKAVFQHLVAAAAREWLAGFVSHTHPTSMAEVVG